MNVYKKHHKNEIQGEVWHRDRDRDRGEREETILLGMAAAACQVLRKRERRNDY